MAMDCLIGIATSIVGKAAEYTVGPIGRQLGYFFYYKRNVESLKSKVGEDLKNAKDRIGHMVDTATRNGEEIESDVQNWISKVDKISVEAGKLLPRDEGQANTRCSSGFCPNLIQRYRLSKKVNKMAQIIGHILLDAKNFGKVSFRPPLQNYIKNKGYQTFETRMPTFLEIMEALKDANTRMIGVWGMDGVGKTVLVREVARQAKSENLFTQVVMSSISQTPDHKAIQQEIAENLGLKFDVDTISIRAEHLQERLRKEKKILLILDDVWTKLDLEYVGISFTDDQKECKILLTSRSEDVLCNDMGVKRTFKVGVLSEGEAKYLFNQIVGDLVKENEFQELVRPIVKECAGLPLAISTVANALKNKSLSTWKDALKELKTSNPVNIKGVDEKVYSSIKLSYKFLHSEEAKSLLLLCSLHKEDADIGIDDLLMYGMGLSLFHGITKLEDARNRVFHLAENLKTSSLLLAGSSDNFVKMHDVIRDVVISIASKERHMYNIRSVRELNERFNNKELEDSTAISLSWENDNDLLHERLLCSKLKLFSLFKKGGHLQIPNHYFEGAGELQVLSLDWVHLDLPCLSSFPLLQNLRTLVLRGCELGDITVIGEIKSLEILNLSESSI